jgi:hypothetical protein
MHGWLAVDVKGALPTRGQRKKGILAISVGFFMQQA